MRFGAVATGVIVVQVALCVAFIPVAIMNGQDLLRERTATGFPADSYLTGRLTRQVDPPGLIADGEDRGQDDEETAAALFDEVHHRLAAEPGVLAATRTGQLPGFNHAVEAMEIETDSTPMVEVRQVAVDPNFFDVVDARIVSGRPFHESDVMAGGAVAIVDQAWARETFVGQSPLGQRIRYPKRPDEEGARWYEIVGVVTDVDRAIGPGSPVAVFHPLLPGEQPSVQLYLQTAGIPAALAPQVLDLIISVDPAVGVADLQPLSETWRPVQRSDAFFAAACPSSPASSCSSPWSGSTR